MEGCIPRAMKGIMVFGDRDFVHFTDISLVDSMPSYLKRVPSNLGIIQLNVGFLEGSGGCCIFCAMHMRLFERTKLGSA